MRSFTFYPQFIELIQKLNALQNEGKATVFFEFMGHVTQFQVRIFIPNWEAREPDFKQEMYLDAIEVDESIVNAFVNRVTNFISTIK